MERLNDEKLDNKEMRGYLWNIIKFLKSGKRLSSQVKMNNPSTVYSSF